MGIHIHLPLQKLSCGDADAELLLYVFPLIHFPNQNPVPTPLKAPAPSVGSDWISVASPLSLWRVFGIINDAAPSNIYKYGDPKRSAYAPPYRGIDLNRRCLL